VLVGGVTLQVFVPASLPGALGASGSQVQLFTHLRIREDQPVLYGFATEADRDAFLLLMTVSGVGPRHSMGLLATLGVAGVQRAIETGDVTALSTAPGIGRRTAGRLVLELKGMIVVDETAASPVLADSNSEVVEALTALGYSATEARRTVSALDPSPDATVEDRIRLALMQLAGG
jgi:Holliday junction DNA helicase RuvA